MQIASYGSGFWLADALPMSGMVPTRNPATVTSLHGDSNVNIAALAILCAMNPAAYSSTLCIEGER